MARATLRPQLLYISLSSQASSCSFSLVLIYNPSIASTMPPLPPRRPRARTYGECHQKTIVPNSTVAVRSSEEIYTPRQLPNMKHVKNAPLGCPRRNFLSVANHDPFPFIRSGTIFEEGPFKDENATVIRRRMPHHPYPKEDAPYMQAYTAAVLEK